jgi:predicted RND superfamily exporter protein
MAHSLNNSKASDFMERTSQYSTHGSRRGYVDLGLHILETDYNREALIVQKVELQQKIADFRRKHNIDKRITLVSLQVPNSATHDVRTLKKLKRIRRFTAQELGSVLTAANKVELIDKQLKKMPKSRVVYKKKSEQMIAILKERSPELYEALELEALKQIARATAKAVRPDELKN